MTIYFISRHTGAIEWATSMNLQVDRFLQHIDDDIFVAGDIVIGTLPINMVCELQNRNIKVLSLILDLPLKLRGKELSQAELVACNARLVNYQVKVQETLDPLQSYDIIKHNAI